MKTKFVLFLVVVLTCQQIKSSNSNPVLSENIKDVEFHGQEVPSLNYPQLNEYFSEFSIFNINSEMISDFVEGSGKSCSFLLHLGNSFHFSISIELNDISSKVSFIKMITENGIDSVPKQSCITYKGIENTYEGTVRLSITKSFLYGFINYNNEDFFIEPLTNFNISENGKFVLYSSKSVKTKNVTCALNLINEKKNNIQKSEEFLEIKNACKELEIEEVADYSMYQKFSYNTTQLFTNHIESILNMVEPNYAPFNLTFIIVEEMYENGNYNTWTTTTDPQTLLNTFNSWAVSNITTQHDIGQLWTNRDLDGTVIGIADAQWYSGSNYGTCHTNKYNVVQDYFSDANSLRALSAHEMGHNFNAKHDDANIPNIMETNLNANAISFASIATTDMNNYLTSISCLNSCPLTVICNNDDCNGAVTLTSNGSCPSCSVDNAAKDYFTVPSCDLYTPQANILGAGVFFNFTAQNTSHTIIVTPTGTLDAIIVVYSGGCYNLQEIPWGCMDTPGGNGVITTLTVNNLTIGQVYTIRVYDYGSLNASSGGFSICLTGSTTTISENTIADKFIIYPNPANDKLNVEFEITDSVKQILYTLYNSIGQIVLVEKIDNARPGKIEKTFDINLLNSGIYQLQIKLDDGTFINKKIVIQK